MQENNPDQDSKAESVSLFEEDVCKCALFLILESASQAKSYHGFMLPSSWTEEESNSNEPTKILIALSGGIDSTALVLAMADTRAAHKLELHAAHFNHKLRGSESSDDEAHCDRLCAEMNIPLHKETDAHNGTRGRRNPNSEDALRRRRYDFLERTATSIGAQIILTGHNLDDQAETILFRLLRGTALAGMRGMQPFRQLAGGSWLIRPMLGIPRAEIARYIISRQILAREDSSNLDVRYTRNFIRHQIMPALKERFPAALRRIENFACTAAIDEDYLNNVARRHYDEQNLEASAWQVDTLKPLHQAILDRIVALGLIDRKIPVTTDLIEAIRKQIDKEYSSAADLHNARFSIDKTWDLVRDVHCIQWLNKTEADEAPAKFSVKLRVPGSTPVLRLNKAIQIEEYDELSSVGEELTTDIAVDLTRLDTPLIFRRREPGDCIQPSGRRQQTSLKKYLHRRKASQLEHVCRAKIETQWSASHCPVLASENEVLWIPGVGVSEKLRVQPDGKPTHRIRLVDLASGSSTIC